MNRWMFAFLAMVILFVGLCVARGWPETLRWTNPTMDNTGAALSAADQAVLKNYLRYRPAAGGSWTYFAETAGGKSLWVGTLPVAAGIEADYSVSAALKGQDGIERDSAMSVPVRYTVPFPPGPTPGSPTGPTISRP